jgi:class 3 adenylate cyclase
MEPRIQYAKTKDGVNIAYWVMGRGPPLVIAGDPPWSHIQLEWNVPVQRTAYNLLAAERSLVRFDSRGLGLSDRDVDDLSLDSRILDLEAVVDSLGYESFALGAAVRATPLAIAYAARYSERVSHLGLLSPMVGEMDAMQVPRWQAMLDLSDLDWDLYLESSAAQTYGLGSDVARGWVDFARACVTPETARRYFDAMEGDDVTEYLARVSAPTLLIHFTVSWASIDSTRRIASRIPNAHMVALEDNYLEGIEQAMSAINEFLGEGEEALAASELAGDDIHTILFTDIEGSTNLTQRLGDAKAQDILRIHNTIVRDALNAHNGSETKHTGDGIMASFTSASSALEAAVAIQKALGDHNEANPDTAIRVRIGLNAGEPVTEDEDLFGTAVQLAARVCDKAEPGQILVADVVQQLAAGKGFTFADMGEATLKGFEKPVRLHEVRWHD